VSRSRLPLVTVGTVVLALTACGGGTDGTAAPAPSPPTTDEASEAATEASSEAPSAEPSGSGGSIEGCDPASLETLSDGVVTFATSEPAFEPWMVEDDPTSGEGYESAVAYAVAETLGYDEAAVEWVRVPFDAAISPGPKDFDAALNQFSITDERRQAVDFSSPYYDVRQAVVTVEGSVADGMTALDQMGELLFGAQVGTTSLDAVVAAVGPTMQPQVFNSNEDAVNALSNGQVDAIVLDLPSAFFATAVQLEGGVILGQLPQSGEAAEQFGMVLDLGSPLTDCVSQAVDALQADGTLDALQAEWLVDVAGAPELS